MPYLVVDRGSVQIRAATLPDSEALVRVHTASIRELCSVAYPADEIEAWVGDLRPDTYAGWIDTRLVLVAEVAGEIAGLGQLNPATGEVDKLYVHPAFARRGVGSALLRALEERARERGFREVFLRATLNAVPFYAAAGFESQGRTSCSLRAGGAIAGERMVKRLASE